MNFNEKLSFIIILIFVVLAFTVAFILAENSNKITSYTEYTVEQGDTLWGIAKQSNIYNGENTRDIVKLICEASGCDTTIQAGQKLLIPQN